MKCSKCNCDLSPEEKDNILAALAEGIQKPNTMCEDCQNRERFEDDEDWDDEYGEMEYDGSGGCY